jgi:diacylglycerol kinase
MLYKNKKWREGQVLPRAAYNACRGLANVLRQEVSWRIELTIFVLVLGVALWLRFSYEQIALIVLASSMVLTLEVTNTVLEELADVVEPKYNERIRRIKDMMAGAVLVASIGATVIGLLLFVPPLLGLV